MTYYIKVVGIILFFSLFSCNIEKSEKEGKKKDLEESAEDFEDKADVDKIDNDPYQDTTRDIDPDEIILEDGVKRN